METIKNIVLGLTSLLPDNPFDTAFSSLGDGSTWWGYVNYFVPVSGIIAVASGWATCMALYFAWTVISKLIEEVGTK